MDATPGAEPIVRWSTGADARLQQAVPLDDALLITVGSSSEVCVALLRPDLGVSWSAAPRFLGTMRLRVAVIDGEPRLFRVGASVVRWFVIEASSGALGSEHQAAGSSQTPEAVRVGDEPSGGFLVVWNNEWTIRALGYDAEGRPRGEPKIVTSNGRYPELIRDSDRWLIGYHELRDDHLYGPVMQSIAADGSATSDPVYPAGRDANGRRLHAGRADSGLHAAWTENLESSESGLAIRYARLDASLLPVASPTTLVEVPSGGLEDLEVAPEGTLLSFFGYDGAGGFAVIPHEASATPTILRYDMNPRPRVGWAGSVPIALWESDGVFQAMRLPLP